jgi:hypothetical protein
MCYNAVCEFTPNACFHKEAFLFFLCLLLRTEEITLTVRVDLNHDTSAQHSQGRSLVLREHLLNCRRIAHQQLLHVCKDFGEIDCPCD